MSRLDYDRPDITGIVFDELDDIIAQALSGAGGGTKDKDKPKRALEEFSPTDLRILWRAGLIDPDAWKAELIARGESPQSADTEISNQMTIGVSTAASTRGQLTASELAKVNAIKAKPPTIPVTEVTPSRFQAERNAAAGGFGPTGYETADGASSQPAPGGESTPTSTAGGAGSTGTRQAAQPAAPPPPPEGFSPMYPGATVGYILDPIANLYRPIAFDKKEGEWVTDMDDKKARPEPGTIAPTEQGAALGSTRRNKAGMPVDSRGNVLNPYGGSVPGGTEGFDQIQTGSGMANVYRTSPDTLPRISSTFTGRDSEQVGTQGIPLEGANDYGLAYAGQLAGGVGSFYGAPGEGGLGQYNPGILATFGYAASGDPIKDQQLLLALQTQQAALEAQGMTSAQARAALANPDPDSLNEILTGQGLQVSGYNLRAGSSTKPSMTRGDINAGRAQAQLGLSSADRAAEIAANRDTDNPIMAAQGYDDVVWGPTTFVAGEAGPEYVNIQPMDEKGDPQPDPTAPDWMNQTHAPILGDTQGWRNPWARMLMTNPQARLLYENRMASMRSPQRRGSVSDYQNPVVFAAEGFEGVVGAGQGDLDFGPDPVENAPDPRFTPHRNPGVGLNIPSYIPSYWMTDPLGNNPTGVGQPYVPMDPAAAYAAYEEALKLKSQENLADAARARVQAPYDARYGRAGLQAPYDVDVTVGTDVSGLPPGIRTRERPVPYVIDPVTGRLVPTDPLQKAWADLQEAVAYSQGAGGRLEKMGDIPRLVGAGLPARHPGPYSYADYVAGSSRDEVGTGGSFAPNGPLPSPPSTQVLSNLVNLMLNPGRKGSLFVPSPIGSAA